MKFRIMETVKGSYKIEYKEKYGLFWWTLDKWVHYDLVGGTYVTQRFSSIRAAEICIDEFCIERKRLEEKKNYPKVVKNIDRSCNG